jgi:hypothetical protein
LRFIGQSFGDARWRAARDRQSINVTQKVERNLLPIGRDIDIHPCPFVNRNGDLPNRHARRGGDIPFFRILLVDLVFCMGAAGSQSRS